MTLREIQDIISKGETQITEFKHKAAHPEKIVKEIVAFANKKGGKLIIGVNDDGSIKGVKYAEEEIYTLNRAIDKYCKPKIFFKYEIIPVSHNRSVVCYHIPESRRKPHKVIEDFTSNTGIIYVRVEDRSIQASDEIREILKKENQSRGIKFQYGTAEKILMEYLDKNNEITLLKFSQIAQIDKKSASRKLVLLVLANVLQVTPDEKEDIYTLKPI